MIAIKTNLSEKKNRRRNFIISGLAEEESEGKFVGPKVFELISPIEPKLTERDLVLVKRIGRNDNTGENKTKPRLVLATVKQKADAVLLHNNGKGRKITCQDNKICWINPDLTRTERKILYEKREKRRQKINEEKKKTTVTTPQKT